MNANEPGYYLVFFKDGQPIVNNVTQDTIHFLVESNKNFINWFYSDVPFYAYGSSLQTLKLLPTRERSFKGVF